MPEGRMQVGQDPIVVWWGHACIEIRTPGGRTVIIDPWFGNPRSPRTAEDVPACDVLLVTHGHADHLGDAVALGIRLRPDWPAIHELSLWASRNVPGGTATVTGMNKGGTVELRGLRITMVHADHSGGEWNEDTATAEYRGEPVGFVIELEDGRRLYHAGDTNLFGDMRLIGELYQPEVAFLPIGGHYTMGPREAAVAAEMLGVSVVVPIHYGTFPILVGTPEQLRRELAARGRMEIAVLALEPGRPRQLGADGASGGA
jgi:L-ascorbate metabolism protein UlaG (beta-lactamase superfamily)